ncbi:hypothetical protein tinsulaeT_36330 [Thalassotalea insulae]|uniref:Uncharacterized protein n=1 Tax=Thalassotalea insulae TaxID=2056778 RepID=A0ABQ6GWL3_9GAMM|nr:hypothetical protein [Thalassotalea insulae]GLX80293.1 hypothetical protein tinsulaeT_36330 [Thalassotalea insulae]
MNNSYLFLVLLFFIRSVFAQGESALESQLTELDKAIGKEQLATLEQEQAILESMEEVVEQLDLLTIDKQQRLSELKPLSKPQQYIEQQDEFELLEQGLLDDGFDDLDIEQELADELDDLVLPKKILKQHLPVDKKLLNKPKSAVGVQGEEELIINQLDNSNLMDFDAQSDVWLPEVEKFPMIKQSEIDDIE